MRSVHRIIEMHAATSGDTPAIIESASACSYRELNTAANTLARRLMAAGLRRGMAAHVSMPPSSNLAVLLLAILKAGGCYTWTDDASAPPLRIEESSGVWRDLDISDVAVEGLCGGPNLPVIARETDIACILNHEAGDDRAIAVPHATIISMAACAATDRSPWAGESGAFDLWAALMNGATAVVTERPAAA